jgi:hypothetical protein
VYEVSVREVPARRLLSLVRYVHDDEFPAVARDFFGRFGDGSVPLVRASPVRLSWSITGR